MVRLQYFTLPRRERRSKDFVCKVETIVKSLYQGDYLFTGGAEDLEVYWVKQGEQFEISEYDGKEGVVIIGEIRGIIA